MKLTPKQIAFVQEYLCDLNATQAAIRAGYSAKTAEWIGPQLLGKTHVFASIKKGMDEREKRTQIFIETPYRNDVLLETALQTLKPSTRLCVACDLTAASETIISLPVQDWPKERPNLKKRPSIFIIYAQ